jgi:hypothetical protein
MLSTRAHHVKTPLPHPQELRSWPLLCTYQRCPAGGRAWSWRVCQRHRAPIANCCAPRLLQVCHLDQARSTHMLCLCGSSRCTLLWSTAATCSLLQLTDTDTGIHYRSDSGSPAPAISGSTLQ